MEIVVSLVGWDIGGVHTKAAWIGPGREDPAIRTISLAFEIWRAPARLPEILREALAGLAVPVPDAMGITMTAELSDAFRHRREGVLFVLDAVEKAFPGIACHALGLDGRWATLEEARQRPLEFAAANWLASARYVASHEPDCLLVDVGSTTTDIVSIRDGQVAAVGRTDVERLAAGELVYTGVLRTNPSTLVDWVPLRGGRCPVAAEYFAVMGDVYVTLGHLSAADYTTGTPDGRGKTPVDARARLARLVCADEETLERSEIDLLARYLYEKQLEQVVTALMQVVSRSPATPSPVVPVGLGAFLAREAGRRMGLPLSPWATTLGTAATLPCLAAAWLLAGEWESIHDD
jgi:probable H4MPT-linked C1 transfer pathway protein